jgi:hypothetical protein
MLDAVPDLRPSLRNATEQELADLLAAFDVTISYDKPNRRLTLTATIRPGLIPPPENDDDRPEGRSLMFGIAGRDSNPRSSGHQSDELNAELHSRHEDSSRQRLDPRLDPNTRNSTAVLTQKLLIYRQFLYRGDRI